MSISLYHATIPSYIQIIDAMLPVIEKAEAFCQENAISPADIVLARLAEDMLPYTFQITSVCHHSMGAIEGIKKGQFSPNRDMSEDFAGIRERLTNTSTMLKSLSENEVNELMGKPLRFVLPGAEIPFVAEDFLLSFSQPNFYFHATTSYDILRWKGLDIGKRDFLGRMRSLST
jgi:uncharacterized protein